MSDKIPSFEYRCVLLYKADFAPGERKEMQPYRAYVLINGHPYDVPDLSEIDCFRANNIHATKPTKFYLCQVFAKKTPQRPALAETLPFTLYNSVLNSVVLDICAPLDLVFVCENTSDQPDTLTFSVAGKCITNKEFKAGA